MRPHKNPRRGRPGFLAIVVAAAAFFATCVATTEASADVRLEEHFDPFFWQAEWKATAAPGEITFIYSTTSGMTKTVKCTIIGAPFCTVPVTSDAAPIGKVIARTADGKNQDSINNCDKCKSQQSLLPTSTLNVAGITYDASGTKTI
jgi:hypothetical protein